MTKTAAAKKPTRAKPTPQVDMTMVRTNYYMPKAYKAGLVQAAKASDGKCTPTDIVRDSVRKALHRHGIEVPACP